MAHKTLINGTAYEVSGGKTLVNGTGYSIDKGKTMVDGTVRDIDFKKVYYVSFIFIGTDEFLDALKAGRRLKDYAIEWFTSNNRDEANQIVDGQWFAFSNTVKADHTYITVNGVNYNEGLAVNIPVVEGSYIHFYIESDVSDENGYLRVFRKNGESEKLAEGKFHYDLLVDSDMDIMMDYDSDIHNWTFREWWMAQVFYR